MDLKGKVDYRRFDRFDAHQLDGPDYFKKEVRTAAQMTYPELKRFSFTTGKKGAFYGIGLCLSIGTFYWSAFEFFDKLGGINRLSPFIAAWFPNLIFGFGGVWMLLRVKT